MKELTYPDRCACLCHEDEEITHTGYPCCWICSFCEMRIKMSVTAETHRRYCIPTGPKKPNKTI